MRRLLTFLIGLLFAVSLAGPVAAVDKKEKKTKEKTEEQKKPTSADTTKSADKKKEEKKYDDFVDKNKNGIDDRQENVKEKADKSKKDKG